MGISFITANLSIIYSYLFDMEKETQEKKLILNAEVVKSTSTDVYKSEKLVFQAEPAKLKFYSLAYDNTMVLIRSSAGVDQLIHVDINNQILWHEIFPQRVELLFLATSKDLYAICRQTSEIFMCSLISKIIKKVDLSQNFSSRQLKVFVFETMFCLVQLTNQEEQIKPYLSSQFQRKGYEITKNINSGKLKIKKTVYGKFVYYSILNCFLQKSYEKKQGIYNLTKVNNDSHLGWFDRQLGQVHILSHQFERILKISQDQISFQVLDVYPVAKIDSIYLFKVKIQHPKEHFTEGRPHFKLFTCTYVSKGKLLKEYTLTSNDHNVDLTTYNNFSCQQIGKVTVIYIRKTLSHAALLFVDSRTKEVFSMIQLTGSFYELKIPQWSNSIFWIEDLQRLNSRKVKNIEIDIFDISQINKQPAYLHLIESINPEFDDDLLQDAVQLLCQD